MYYKDVKQLTPTDRPIKIQKELGLLGYKFNTSDNENYFLFCLKDEMKNKMNERNSIMIGGPNNAVVPKKDKRYFV